MRPSPRLWSNGSPHAVALSKFPSAQGAWPLLKQEGDHSQPSHRGNLPSPASFNRVHTPKCLARNRSSLFSLTLTRQSKAKKQKQGSCKPEPTGTRQTVSTKAGEAPPSSKAGGSHPEPGEPKTNIMPHRLLPLPPSLTTAVLHVYAAAVRPSKNRKMIKPLCGRGSGRPQLLLGRQKMFPLRGGQ